MNIGKVLAAVSFVLLSCLAAESASVGVPGMTPGNRRFIFTLEYASSTGRMFSDDRFDDVPVDTDSFHYLGRLSYGLTDRLSLFARAGYSDLAIYGKTMHPYSRDLGWGGGASLVLYEDLKVGTSFIAGAQYYTFTPETPWNEGIEWQEWDASLKMLIVNYVADTRELIEPFTLSHATFYLGLRYSDAIINWRRDNQRGRLKTDGDNFGYFAGIDLVFNDTYMLTLEGRFRDENAYSAGIGFKF